MDNFEFLFSLLGLLLGFVLVEVLSGFVRAVKAGRPHRRGQDPAVRVGWLSLLLASFVMIDVASYWTNVWEMRAGLTVGYDTVFGSLIIAGLYYFAASMVFPDDLTEWPDLDEWFWLNKRRVLLCILTANAVTMTLFGLLTAQPSALWGMVLSQVAYFVPLAIAAFARGPRVFGAAMGFIMFVYVLYGLTSLVARLAP